MTNKGNNIDNSGTNDPINKTILLDDRTSNLTHSTVFPDELKSRYKIEGVLGRGGYGMVYIATDLLIGRKVAIKQLYRHLELQEEVYQGLIREAGVAGRITHPNVITIYTVELVADTACIVMECLNGGSLASRIKLSEKPFTPEDTATIAISIFNALECAHRAGIIHRDLKPENILFDSLGVAKVSDFGIAQLTYYNLTPIGENETKRLGTPLYMAPELHTKSEFEEITSAVDFYAVGVILLEMLQGARLSEQQWVIDLQQKGRPYWVSRFLPTVIMEMNLPPAIRDILLQLISHNPDNRPSDAEAVANRFQEFLGGSTPLAVTATNPTTNMKHLRDAFELLLSDGILVPQERLELRRRIERLSITQEAAEALEEQIRHERNLPPVRIIRKYEKLVAKLPSLPPKRAEKRNLKKYAERLGLTEEQALAIETYMADNRYRQTYNFRLTN